MQCKSGLLFASVLTLSTACTLGYRPERQEAQASPIRVAQPRAAVLPIMVQTPADPTSASQPFAFIRPILPPVVPPVEMQPGVPTRLLGKEDLVYQGAFRARPFDYGGHGMAYDPTHNSLWMVGHVQDQLVGEVGVPEIRKGAVANLADGILLTPLTDVLAGKRNTIDGDTGTQPQIGGLWPFTGSDGRRKLAITEYRYYDAGGSTTLSHFVRDLMTGSVSGPFRTTVPKAGMIAGAFAQIPVAWRPLLGGSVLNGQNSIPIIARSSLGPSAWVIDPNDIGAKSPIPVAPRVYYPIEHPTLGVYGTQTPPSNYFNGSGGYPGFVFPDGTRTVLFFGTHGIGPYCYGDVTQDPALHGTLQPNGRPLCYDPENPYAGPHSHPYVFRVLAYDAQDLVAVKQGSKQPWAVVPYAYWDLDWPHVNHAITGAAYDPGTGRIFVGQDHGDGTAPLIHVYNIR